MVLHAELEYSSSGCNRSVGTLSCGPNDIYAYGSHNAVVLYDTKVGTFLQGSPTDTTVYNVVDVFIQSVHFIHAAEWNYYDTSWSSGYCDKCCLGERCIQRKHGTPPRVREC